MQNIHNSFNAKRISDSYTVGRIVLRFGNGDITSVVERSEFLAIDPEAPGSIRRITRLAE
jgi:hypothetical protein